MTDLAYSETPPPSALAPYVRCLWRLHGPAPSTAPDVVLPDGMPELVINFADPFTHHPGDAAPSRQPKAILVGQITRPFGLQPGRAVDVLGIRFWPAGAHALLGLPMGMTTDGYLDLADVDGTLATAVAQARGEPRWANRERRVVQALGRLAQSATDDGLQRLTRRVLIGATDCTVDRLSGLLGLSPRQLSRRFGQDVGIGPKRLLRIVRFQRAVRALESDAVGSLTRVALTCGYHDHAHLTREFRRLAGRTPSSFVGEGPGLAHVLIDGTGRRDQSDRRLVGPNVAGPPSCNVGQDKDIPSVR
jgi:AraC-like DNA-binding protein